MRQKTGAGEEHAHQVDGQLELLAAEPRRDNGGQGGRGEYADEDQARHRESEQAEDGGGDPVGLVFCFMGKQIGVDRDKGGREGPFAKEVLEEVRDAEGGPERIGRV